MSGRITGAARTISWTSRLARGEAELRGYAIPSGAWDREQPGHPVCSVYAWGTDEPDTTTQLFEAAASIGPLLERVAGS